MKWYQCDLCEAMTSEHGIFHHIRYDAPRVYSAHINTVSGLPNDFCSMDAYLCKRCAKKVLKPFLGPEYFEDENQEKEENND